MSNLSLVSSINAYSDHGLKYAFQKVIEEECDDLFRRYGIRIRRIIAEIDSECGDILLAVEVVSSVFKEILNAQQRIFRDTIYNSHNHAIYNGANTAGNFFNHPVVAHIFHILARALRTEIEKKIKDLPMTSPYNMANYSAGLGTAANVMFTNSMTYSLTPNEVRKQYGMNDLESATKKKSKFIFIDKLIEESKERLVGHANPRFIFKYF